MSEYKVQVQQGGSWWTLLTDRRGFCQGYFQCYRESPGPRCAIRVVGPTGRVIDEAPAKTDVSLGMVVGWPTPEQYERAAARALETAAAIRHRRAAEDDTL